MKAKIYYSPEDVRSMTLTGARTAFVAAAINQVRCVMVWENGLNVGVSINEPQSDSIRTIDYPNYNKVDEILRHVF